MSVVITGIALGFGILALMLAFFLVLAARSAHAARSLGPAPGSASGPGYERPGLPPADLDFYPVAPQAHDDGFEPLRMWELPDIDDDVFKPAGLPNRVNGKPPVRRCRVCGRPKTEGVHNH